MLPSEHTNTYILYRKSNAYTIYIWSKTKTKHKSENQMTDINDNSDHANIRYIQADNAVHPC